MKRKYNVPTEPMHNNTKKVNVHTAKTQISLEIPTVC